MAQQNGGAAGVATHEMITPNGEHPSSLDGAGAPGEQPFADRPELLVGVAFVAGFLLGGLVSRIGR